MRLRWQGRGACFEIVIVSLKQSRYLGYGAV